MKSGWVAVVPQGGLVRVAQVSRRADRRPRVGWVSCTDWGDPPQALRLLQRSRQLQAYRCAVLLQGHQYQWLSMEAPELERAQWRDALRWQLRDQVEFPVEDAAIDLLEIPAELSQRGRGSLMVVAAPHAELAGLTQTAADVAQPWQAIDVPETALRNIAVLHEAGNQGVALLHVGERECSLVITARAELLQARRIECTLRHLLDEHDFYREAAYERIGLELQRSLDSFERLFGRVSLSRLVVAGAGLEAFMAYLREILYLPVQALSLGEVLDLSRVTELQSPQEQAAYLIAIGAALRDEAPGADGTPPAGPTTLAEAAAESLEATA